MLSRIRFRQNAPGAQITPTRTSNTAAHVWGIVGTAVVMALFLYATIVDERSHASVQQAAELERQRIAMQPMAMQAYEAGLADGVAAVKDTPQGVPFMQACLAMRGRL